MEDKEQNEFIAWLSEQLQVSSQEDLQQKVEEMGEEGLQKAHLAFQKSKVQQYMNGGRLKIIERLSEVRRKNSLKR